MKEYKLREISSFLLYWKDYEYIKEIELNLNSKIQNTHDPIQREEIYYLIILFRIIKYQTNSVILEKNLIEYKKIINQWLVSYETKKIMKNSNKLKIIFLRNVLNHISQLRFNCKYQENVFSNSLKYFENEIKMVYYKSQWDYYLIIKQYLYKYIVGYWVWYKQIFYSTIFTWFIFWLIYFFYDLIDWNWILIKWISEYDWRLVWWFDYYLYLSINILSNLWTDSTIASNIFLKMLFSLEQVIWVMFFWIFVFMIWKKI